MFKLTEIFFKKKRLKMEICNALIRRRCGISFRFITQIKTGQKGAEKLAPPALIRRRLLLLATLSPEGLAVGENLSAQIDGEGNRSRWRLLEPESMSTTIWSVSMFDVHELICIIAILDLRRADDLLLSFLSWRLILSTDASTLPAELQRLLNTVRELDERSQCMR